MMGALIMHEPSNLHRIFDSLPMLFSHRQNERHVVDLAHTLCQREAAIMCDERLLSAARDLLVQRVASASHTCQSDVQKQIDRCVAATKTRPGEDHAHRHTAIALRDRLRERTSENAAADLLRIEEEETRRKHAQHESAQRKRDRRRDVRHRQTQKRLDDAARREVEASIMHAENIRPLTNRERVLLRSLNLPVPDVAMFVCVFDVLMDVSECLVLAASMQTIAETLERVPLARSLLADGSWCSIAVRDCLTSCAATRAAALGQVKTPDPDVSSMSGCDRMRRRRLSVFEALSTGRDPACLMPGR